MKLYVCMILSGSICTLAYLIFNRILPYEMSLKWMRLIFAALVVFCLLSVGGLFLYGRIYRQFIRRSEISDDNWRMESKRLWRKIRIGYSPLASSPVTVGMIRPVILFPSGRKQYSDSKEEIIRHELERYLFAYKKHIVHFLLKIPNLQGADRRY